MLLACQQFRALLLQALDFTLLRQESTRGSLREATFRLCYQSRGVLLDFLQMARQGTLHDSQQFARFSNRAPSRAMYGAGERTRAKKQPDRRRMIAAPSASSLY